MADTFTIERTYDRDAIMEDARKVMKMGGELPKIRHFLDTMYAGWSLDIRTSIMVELMYRNSDDPLYEMFQDKLAELNMAEKTT